MKALEEKILKEGKILPGDVINIGSFLNQRIDVSFAFEMANEIKRLFDGCDINKVLTIESSGIALATLTALLFNVPLVFVKKSPSANQPKDVLKTQIHSYTHGNTYTATVGRAYLSSDDRILIVDDFLAVGGALHGLMDLVKQSGASLVGCAVAVEKGFQPGGRELRESGIRVESLAIVDYIDENLVPHFRNQDK